jgi:hypothetical protein
MTTSTRSAPSDDGEKLATIDRGPGKQLRIRLRRFSGHQFIDLREWSSRDGGEWWPVKGRGITIKPREPAAVVRALQDAERLAS